jgi:hypothetical protein
MFCVEGKIHYNKSQNQMIYIYNYRNEFIVTDSNLNLTYRGHTIDSFRHAQIKIAKTKDNESMMSRPPMQTNGRSCISEKYLFVQSNLLANNESIESFTNNTVIDIYELENGRYIKSFYIPGYENTKSEDFQVIGNQLLAIHDRHLITYDLPTDLTKKNKAY